jgi:hypothetical protein
MAQPCRAPLKQRSAFFTPAVVSRFLADWAVRSPHDLILEPSCGEAAFLLAAVDALRSRGSDVSGSQLFGIDIHPESIKTAEIEHLGSARDLLFSRRVARSRDPRGAEKGASFFLTRTRNWTVPQRGSPPLSTPTSGLRSSLDAQTRQGARSSMKDSTLSS